MDTIYSTMSRLEHTQSSLDRMKFDQSLIPEPVRRLCSLLGPDKNFVVGGIIRDSIVTTLSRPENRHADLIQSVVGNDWDIATPLKPKEVLKRLRKENITAVPIGIEHGTVAAILDDIQYEITTFRTDLEYADGRHPIVRFADSIEEDLKRRDFTINALALDVETGELLDLFDGIEHLQQKRIQTVGDPEERFSEDYLRMLRAVRFAAKLEGTIEHNTVEAIRRNAPLITQISPERIRDETMKLLTYPKPSIGFILMHNCELLRYIMPELEIGFGVGQNRFHSDDVAMHTLHAVDALSPKYPFYRFVTLMHDLGKVPAKRYLERKKDYVFYGHQYISKRLTNKIMRRLRFSNKEIEKAAAIVENHMYNLKPDLSHGATKRFIRKLGRDQVEGFLRMRMADRKGNRLNDDGYERGIFHFVRTLKKIDRDAEALTLRDLNIDGYDLMNLGLKPGPIFSEILDQLLEYVLDDPALNQREWLLERAKEFAEEFARTGKITKSQNNDIELEED